MALDFVLPEGLQATEPPPVRDGVRLLVARPSGVAHARFSQLGEFLSPGDLVVVNTSATYPAAVDGSRAGVPVEVHFSAELDGGAWVVEVRPSGASAGPVTDLRPGEVITLDAGAALTVGRPHPAGQVRLWRARPLIDGGVSLFLTRHGRPIRYAYVPRPWPLPEYQTVFAREPGSAEMPSAGRPFTDRVVTDLVTRGVTLAPIVLHTGVSSQEPGEPPQPERFRVPEATARLVNVTRQAGGRVIAVGTTVTRALESAAAPDGSVRAGQGWTDLVLGPAQRRPGRERPGDRLARARGVTPRAAHRGGGQPWPCRARVRRGSALGLPLARVRRQLPATAIKCHHPERDRASRPPPIPPRRC